MKPKPPKPIWCVIRHDGSLAFARTLCKQAKWDRAYGERIIRYIPAPTKPHNGAFGDAIIELRAQARIAALEAEVKVLREWIAAYTHTRPHDWIPPSQPFTPNPWPHSPFTWGSDGTGTQPPGCPQPMMTRWNQ